MHTGFQKQIQFSEYIKAGGRLREFNFLKMTNSTSPSFNVDVSDERGRRHHFLLTYGSEGWKMDGEGLPGWIQDSTEAILSVVESHKGK